ncbi:MAG: hypothetical protein JWO03_383 [Bacteroidetes bacterium]|nr:hypothetical protein [Bacteroidota bacterium]
MLHIDCPNDDYKNVFDDIRAIRKITKVPLDLHLISEHPWFFQGLIKDCRIEYVSFQYEDMGIVPDVPQIKGTKFGLAIKSETSLDILEQATDYDYVMLMCTTPGMSGGSFQKENFKRIVEIRHRYPNLKIQIDGGVNDEVGYILRLLGVDSIVSGSFLMNHYSIGSGMLSFYKAPSGGSYSVSDFMVPISYLPVLDENNLSFENVLQTIEKYKQGFVLIVDQSNKLKGVISNADIRRGLISQMSKLDKIDILQMINPNPISISDSADLGQMLTLINELNFIILFLPVVDKEGTLKGAVLLNNLTRG